MSSKLIISKASKLAGMKVLTENILPSTLKYKILLPNIHKISFEYVLGAKQCGPAFQFFRKYCADIRFHNPGLTLERFVDEKNSPTVKIFVYKKDLEEPMVIEAGRCKDIEDLKQKLLEINDPLAMIS